MKTIILLISIFLLSSCTNKQGQIKSDEELWNECSIKVTQEDFEREGYKAVRNCFNYTKYPVTP